MMAGTGLSELSLLLLSSLDIGETEAKTTSDDGMISPFPAMKEKQLRFLDSIPSNTRTAKIGALSATLFRVHFTRAAMIWRNRWSAVFLLIGLIVY